MAWWWCAAPLALLVVVVLLSGRKYARILSPAHYAEVGRAVQGMKATLSEEPSSAVTSADVGIVYSARAEGDGVVHHVSMSYRGEYLARAAALLLIGYLLDRFGVSPEQATVIASDTGVTHVEFTLTAAEHARWRASRIAIAEGAELVAQMRAAHGTRAVLLSRMQHA
jgi:hypothetical protein